MTTATGVLDQVVMSGTSALVAILVARGAGVEEFGQFALVQAFLIFYQGGLRAVPGSWILVELAGRPRQTVESFFGPALRGATFWGSVCGAVMLAVALAIGVRDPWMLAASVLLPVGVSLTTLRRLAHYSFGEAGRALGISVATTALCVPLWLLWPSTGPFHAFVVYAVATFSVGVCVAVPHITAGRSVREFVALGDGFHLQVIGNTALANSRTVLFPWAAQGVAGAVPVAGVRGAQTVAAIPLQVPQGIQPLAQASLSRAQSRASERRGLRRWNVLQAILVVPMCVASVVMPDSVGTFLLGDTWVHAEDSLPWILLGAFVAQVTAGYEMLLRKWQTLRHLLRVKALCLPVALVVAWPLTVAWGATGVALAILLDNLVVMIAAVCLVKIRMKES